MTSSLETREQRPVPTVREDGFALRQVMMAEREAYEAMRALVPDLALPRERRGALTARQVAAIETYHELRDRLEALRSARRSPGLATLDRQSS